LIVQWRLRLPRRSQAKAFQPQIVWGAHASRVLAMASSPSRTFSDRRAGLDVANFRIAKALS